MDNFEGVDGEILTPQLTQREGQFVAAGEELVQIGDRNRKEILVSIGDDQMDGSAASDRQSELKELIEGRKRRL